VFTATAQKSELQRGAGTGIEPGPAVQQADALLSELRRTLEELRRTLLSYAAPFRATPHPAELRRSWNFQKLVYDKHSTMQGRRYGLPITVHIAPAGPLSPS
jgi:hypothetical protein